MFVRTAPESSSTSDGSCSSAERSLILRFSAERIRCWRSARLKSLLSWRERE
jgi:hypothetical protein